MQKPRQLKDEIVNSIKVVLLTIFVSSVLSSCAHIPASSSPEINEDLKQILKSEQIQDGYKRVYVCMGEASIYMPENLVLKNIEQPVKNTKISFFLKKK